MKALVFSLLVMFAASAHAGKVNEIVTAAQSSCGKTIDKNQAIKLIKKVFLTCKSGQKVDVGGCQISCMKSSGGAVVGGK